MHIHESFTHMLDETTHASLGDTTTAENLDSITSSILRTSRGVHLQETNRSCKVLSLLLVGLR